MKTYIIKDWAGNDVFEGAAFSTFDDAEDHLTEYFETTKKDYDEWRQEYDIYEYERETF